MGRRRSADPLTMNEPRHNTGRRMGYLNAVLTAIAVLLALLVLDGRTARTWSDPSEARAQVASPPDDPTATGQALVSASEQRKIMINELRRIASRVERVEAKLAAGISVKVTEMPAQKPQEGK